MNKVQKRRVTTVELSVYDHTLPLVAGYLEAYATQDPLIADTFDFGICSRGVCADLSEVAADLLERRSDIYAFSCYVWNMGAMRLLLDTILENQPEAWCVLGGPQVMGHAADYIPAGRDRVVVCNGEGEQPFYEFLSAVALAEPDLARIPGVSYWSGDGIVTTPRNPRLSTLDDLPSPFAAGIFDGGEYTFAVLETNRGCPFGCGFCGWGAATNSKVYKFDEDRVRGDIRWIAENFVTSVLIADANWGLSPRDVELSKHIVRCREEYGFPVSLVITAAKNQPRRVAEITGLLVRGGLVTSQPISLQTVTPEALELAGRKNIKEEAFTELRETLDAGNISSFIELIWPLPGETLDSFRAGVGRLCRLRAETLTVYPHLLLHNTDMYDRREVLGLEVVRAPDQKAEADVVVATKWVSRAEYTAGTWFYYAMHICHNARAAYYLTRYLDTRGLLAYEQFFSALARFMEKRDDEISMFAAESIASIDNVDMANMGKAAYLCLHSAREAADLLLREFARTQPWWSDRVARAALDIDLVARPYIYDEPVRLPALEPLEVDWTRESADRVLVCLPAELAWLAAELGLAGQSTRRLRLTHPAAGKMPAPRMWGMEHNGGYCHVMIQRIRTLAPEWQAALEAAR